MGRAVVVGHGGFNKQSDFYLVPPKTSIAFLSDAGSNLLMPFVPTGPIGSGWVEGVNCAFDYEKISNVLDQFLEDEEPVAEYKVVPNMFTTALSGKSAESAQKLHEAGKWGAEKFSKDPARLCTGSPATCPTPKLNVADRLHEQLAAKGPEAIEAMRGVIAAGGSGPMPENLAEFNGRLADVPEDMWPYVVDGVPDDRWSHHCDGLLTTFAGSDIVWVCCSGFVADAKTLKELGLDGGLPKEMTAATAAPDSSNTTGILDPLSDGEKNAMRALRIDKYKDVPVGGSIKVRAGSQLVVFGEDYAGNLENHLKRQDDYVEGSAKKVGFLGKLKSVEITGIPGPLQDRVRSTFVAVMTDTGDASATVDFK